MPEITNLSVRELREVPAGYRGLSRCMHETRRSYLFEYYGDELFIPKRSVVKVDGSYWAPAWAIESAKKFNAQRSAAIIHR
ncbi:hypothetical protein [Rhizobium wenxiniae]|uniref:hypothetical protein n=1 Tax=Rhizobium wenxiniae TaxID=1737357 RepID=UPI003C1FB24E